MGRKIRFVPADWKHPKKANGQYKPLFEGNYTKELKSYMEGKRQWHLGYREDFNNEGKYIKKKKSELNLTFEEWGGTIPNPDYYMPEWTEEQKTHMMLYETTSEGTPMTPAFKRDEMDKLCEYAEKHCSTFADMMTTKEHWKSMLTKGFVYAESRSNIFI